MPVNFDALNKDIPSFQVVPPRKDVNLNDLTLPDGTKMVGPDGLLIPPARSFNMIVNSATRVYSYRSDEAMRDNFVAARAMRRDAFIRGLLEERILPTINRKWQLEVDDHNDPVQRYVRDALTRCLRNVDGFDSFKRALLDGVWFGKAGCQWAYAQNPDIDNLWCFSKWDPIHGDSIQNTFDGVPAILLDSMTTGWYASHGAKWGPDGDLRSTDRGGTALVLQRPYWRDRFAVHVHMREKADYLEGELAGSVQGLGLRGLVYWQYVVRTDALTWMLTYMQAVGQMDLLVFNYPASNAAAKAQAETNAAQVIGKAAIAVPRNPTGNWPAVEQISMNEAGLRALHQLVADYFDRHIERLIVGQSMSSGADHGTGLGGTGRADFTKATKDEILIHDTNRLDETVSRDVLLPLKRYNFPWAKFPVRYKSTLPDLDKAAKVASGTTMIQNGVSIKVDEYREAAGFTRPEPGDEVIGGMAGMLSMALGGGGAGMPPEMGMGGPPMLPPAAGGMTPPGMGAGGPGGMPPGAGAGGQLAGGAPLGPGGAGGPPMMSSALGVSGPPNNTRGYPHHPGAVRHAGEGAAAAGPAMGSPSGGNTYMPGFGRKYGFDRRPEYDRFGFTRYEKSGDYKYSTTQVDLTGDAYIKVFWMANQVAETDLADDGRETKPHVTVRYGLKSGVGPDDVAAALAAEGPVRFRLGKVSVFPASPGREYDVIKVDVESEDLRRLNKKLGRLPNVQTFDYHPHATVAYVKPGMGQVYARRFGRVDVDAVADVLVFSTTDKKKTDIILKPAEYVIETQPHAYARHALRAPVGGIAVRNQLFRGGRFVPNPEEDYEEPPVDYDEDIQDAGGNALAPEPEYDPDPPRWRPQEPGGVATRPAPQLPTRATVTAPGAGAAQTAAGQALPRIGRVFANMGWTRRPVLAGEELGEVRLDRGTTLVDGHPRHVFRWTTEEEEGPWTFDEQEARQAGEQKFGGPAPRGPSGRVFTSVSPDAHAIWQNLRMSVPVDDAASLVGLGGGALEGARVHVQDYVGDNVSVTFDHPYLKEPAYRVIGRDDNGDPYIENSSIKLKPEYRDAGVGPQIFSDQVAAAQRAGVKYIKCYAAVGNGLIGGHVWPKFGYDQPFHDFPLEERNYLEAVFPDCESVLDVLATPEGRRWWCGYRNSDGSWTPGNGFSMKEAVFDLDPNGRSMAVLNAYLAEKKAQKASGPGRFSRYGRRYL